MQVLYPCCWGLDVHKKFVVACLITTTAEGQVHKETRTFSTMTQDLLALLDWLHAVRQEAVAVIVRRDIRHDRTWCSITSTLGGEARR